MVQSLSECVTQSLGVAAAVAGITYYANPSLKMETSCISDLIFKSNSEKVCQYPFTPIVFVVVAIGGLAYTTLLNVTAQAIINRRR